MTSCGPQRGKGFLSSRTQVFFHVLSCSSASLRTVVLLPYSCFPVHCNSSGLSPPWVINICREVKEEESAIQHHASSQGLLKVRGGPARCLPGSRARPPARLPGARAGLVSLLQAGIRSWQPMDSLICGGKPGTYVIHSRKLSNIPQSTNQVRENMN